MQGNLHDIITRIKIKLNNFTEEDNPPILNISKKPKSIKYLGIDSFEQQKQYQCENKYRNQIQVDNITKAHKKYDINMSQQKNYQVLKDSTSCKMIQINKTKDPILIHTQTYLSLRKRNKVLEDDVKNLKDRLKLLEQSIQKRKSNPNITEKSIKQKQLVGKNKTIQRVKRSEKMYTNEIDSKNVKKLPFPRNYKFTFQKNSNNSESNTEGNKGKKDNEKKNQTSLHYVTFNDKLKFQLSQSPVKQTSKMFQRNKSYQTLEPTNPSSQQAIKQGKQNTKKQKNIDSIGQSNASNSSYLRPIQKPRQKYGNLEEKLDKRVIENNKLRKGCRNKLQ